MSRCDVCGDEYPCGSGTELYPCYRIPGVKALCVGCSRKVGDALSRARKQMNPIIEDAVRRAIAAMKRPVEAPR